MALEIPTTSNLWFTSDTHFYHSKVIEFCRRPFASVEEMNEAIINNWNAVVRPDDVIYHLGDFSFKGKTQSEFILNRLNGHKHLIQGNHDHSKTVKLSGWESVDKWCGLRYSDVSMFLCHYPSSDWHPYDIMLHGHSHGTSAKVEKRWDVGVDVWNYKPVSLKEVLARDVFHESER